MKRLMLGNEALARGLFESGVKFVSSYPGTPSTEITEYASKYDEIYTEWAPNEKVALESAFGACLSGVRSFCAMKHVGLNVAADALYTMSYTGVNAGLVICVADDPGMHSSQNEQDSRHHAIASKVPMLEPSDSAEAKEIVKIAYNISEKYDTPVIIKMCTRVAHSQSIVEEENRAAIHDKDYIKDASKYVMMPGMAKKRHPIVEQRTQKLVEYAENCNINRLEAGSDNSIGIITHSTCYMYVKEVCGNKYPILKLAMANPLPVNKIKNFAKSVDKLYVVEELDGIIEQHCRAIGCNCVGKNKFSCIDELSQHKISDGLGIKYQTGKDFPDNLPLRPPIMCSGCPHRSIFYLLKKLKINVLGDIGCYTLGALSPLASLDLALCMGASVSSLHGFNKLNPNNAKNTVCVIGDSTFMHSGITGLTNIVYNNSCSTVIILDNSTTGMTGHQPNPSTGFDINGNPTNKINIENLVKSLGVNRVKIIDPYDLDKSQKIIKEELESDEASVIISRRPCVMLKGQKFWDPIVCDTDKCIGCKQCMKIGCPSISMKDKKAKIDQTLCIGCGVCSQLCKQGALISKS